MYRYIAFAWDPTNGETKVAADIVHDRVSRLLPDYSTCLDLPGLRVLLQHRETNLGALTVVNHGGLILGQLFLRSDPSSGPLNGGHPRDRDVLAAKISSTRGRNLVDDWWGSFVAFLHLPTGCSSTVLRSAMGGVPCFRARIGDLCIFFSSIEDFASLCLMPLTVDWQLVAAQATNGDYLTSATAIKEITEIQAGESVAIDGQGVSTIRYWDPGDISRRPQIEDFDTASRLLRHATQESVDGWVSRHPTAMLSLSGGLDSSIVLGCMARSPSRPKITCVTYHSDQLGDERRYARAAAQKLEVDLIELARSKDAPARKNINLRENIETASVIQCV